MRCFVAVDLSDDVRAAIAAAQDALRRAAPDADVRWVDPAAMHLTIKFLGEVAEARRAELAGILDAVGTRHAPMQLRAAGLGAFPNPRRARVVWAGIADGAPALAALAAAVDRACAALGFPPEPRPLSAHVTVGRVRSPRGLDRLAAALEGSRPAAFGSWTAGTFVLYRSRLKPTGAVYEPLARLPCRGGRSE